MFWAWFGKKLTAWKSFTWSPVTRNLASGWFNSVMEIYSITFRCFKWWVTFSSSLAPSCLTDPFDSHLKVWLHYPTSLHLDVERLWAALSYFRGRFQLQITRPSSKILEAPFGRLSEWTQSMILLGSTSCPILPSRMGEHGVIWEKLEKTWNM